MAKKSSKPAPKLVVEGGGGWRSRILGHMLVAFVFHHVDAFFHDVYLALSTCVGKEPYPVSM
jgi:hypothetical protein